VACDFNITVKGEGLLEVTGSHVHWKSDNISETVPDRDVVTTGYLQEVILVRGLSNRLAATVMILSVFGGNSLL